MDSSDTRDLDYKTRDWKYTQPLHGSAAESPQGSNDPTRGIREEMRKLNIGSDDGAPISSIQKDKPIDPYSDPQSEREVFGGLTYEEFDREYRYQYNSSSDPDLKDTISGESDYISFKAFPNAKIRKIVYLPIIDTEDEFDDWVKCLIVQIKISGLESYVPNKENNWSSVIMNNKRLNSYIMRMWKKCIPEECCPAWVEFTPYNTDDSSNIIALELLTAYDRRNKNREIWREAINQTNKYMSSSDIGKLWKEGNNVYRNFFCSKKHHDVEMILECLEQMMIENYANKCEKLKKELENNENINLPTALKLLHNESKKPVKSKSNHNRREDKESKKSPTKTSNSWSRAHNATNRSTKSGKTYNKHVTTKKKGKVNYIEQSSTTNNDFDDVSSGTDSCFLSSD